MTSISYFISVNPYIHELQNAIDNALAVSYRRNMYNDRAAYVGYITLVKGVPFFGYHVGYHFYLKICMFNPLHTNRLADLFCQGSILGRVIQPYENHIQYLLQWMCDFNLYGCAYINCSKVRFRAPVPSFAEISRLHKWNDESIRQDLIIESDEFPRLSHCSIEIDLCVEDILNRKENPERSIHQDFMERFNPTAPDQKLVHSMAGLWRDETIRRKRRMGITDPGSSPFPHEVLVSMSADLRNPQRGGWINEENYLKMIKKVIEDERTEHGSHPIKFEEFISFKAHHEDVKTALESVEDLFPHNIHRFVRIVNNGIDTAPEENEEVPYGEFDISTQDRQVLAEMDLECLSDNGISHQETKSKKRRRSQVLNEGSDYVKVNENEDVTDDQRSGTSRSPDSSSSDHFDPQQKDIDHPVKGKLLLDPEDPRFKRLKIDSHVLVEDGNELDADLKNLISDRSRPLNSRELLSGQNITMQEAEKETTSDLGLDSSQKSIKAQNAPSSRVFPVVKNPNNTDTILRLSQSEFSNTQDVLRTPSAKVEKLSPSRLSPRTPWTSKKSETSSYSQGRANIPPKAIAFAKNLERAYDFTTRRHVYVFGFLPPRADFVQATMMEAGLPSVIYQDAFYSNERDAPERPREYAGREFRIESNTLPYLPRFDATGASPATFGEKAPSAVDRRKEQQAYYMRRQRCSFRNWEFAPLPPSRSQVIQYFKERDKKIIETDIAEVDHDPSILVKQKSQPTKELSQVDGLTQKNKHGFKYSQKRKSTSVQHETQYMSIMSLEVHVNTRDTLSPDPAIDEISCIFWCIQTDDEELGIDGYETGILVLSAEEGMAERMQRQTGIAVQHEEDELDIINNIIDIVRLYDPDILTGYEVHNGSWGYLIERARLKYEYNLCDELSRMKSQSHGRFGKDADRWGFTHTSTIRVTGRHMINIWRAMRGELNLLQYTMENVVFHLLHKRIPHYSFQDLTRWYRNRDTRALARLVDYFTSRVRHNLDILEANELVPRTSEQARLLGVDFFSVISRGSQFKVESLMFRIAKPENFILVSPSRKQVGQQNALECIPLVMEPQSNFFNSPLLVLDFQSLYPSVMIAYNYCYSTCLGRVVNWRGQNKLGFSEFKREPRLLELVKDYVNIAPNGMMYVKPEMRKSLLAKMLGEILETRVMVKSGMKMDKDDRTLQQLLNNRQLALKLIANVTYGYTSASFSGRMPCSEIADSIVLTGRETLERTIALIHSVERWGAEVVYGDTDSIFVYLKGRTREDAFTIGREIADTVTKANPRPIKLKFEKVYHPCVLLAKKRYVGFKYESLSQEVPEFDAKGIETVRRDGTPAEQKIEEAALKLLFRTSDLSAIKEYFQRQCAKIMTGRVSIQDFLFAKEVRLGSYSEKGLPPPGALVATKRMLQDHRAEPQYGERVPYVVIAGAPGARLIDRCVGPEVLLHNENVELDAEYYISKNLIPPLERIFNLVGANIRQWYDEMPKVQRIRNITAGQLNAVLQHGQENNSNSAMLAAKTLENYMKRSICVVCRARLTQQIPTAEAEEADPPLVPLCDECIASPTRSLLAMKTRVRDAERKVMNVEAVCKSCSGLAVDEEVKCDSRDCPVFYTRVKEKSTLASLKEGAAEVSHVFTEQDEKTHGAGLVW